MSGIAWDELLKVGLGDLRLDPEVFWSLTPVELMLLSGRGSTPAQTLDRGVLGELMKRFPDHHKET